MATSGGAKVAALVVSLVLGPTVAARGAAAQRVETSRFAVHLEGYGLRLLDEVNREDFGFGGGITPRLEWNAAGFLGLTVGAPLYWLGAISSDAEAAHYYGIAAGLRLHWSAFTARKDHDGWLDINVDWGESGGIRRSGLDVGFGYQLPVGSSRRWRLGPFARYQWGKSPSGANPSVLIFGAAISLGTRKLSDRDNDGIADAEDVCPDTAQGQRPDPKRPGCPLRDRDRDGVADGNDLCPDLPAGPNPDPERPGCPWQDRDGDTIADRDDACPDEPGAPNADPARHGCPGLVRLTRQRIEVERPIFFATDEAEVLPESEEVLEAVADAILASPWIARVRVEGHADSRGPEPYNRDLSQRRARFVVGRLAAYGVPTQRLRVQAFGEAAPVDTNYTDQGRAENRRVEFFIEQERPASETGNAQ